MAARLNHPSIVHIYDIVETDDGDWIVMELVEGKTLDRMLRDGLPSAAAHRRSSRARSPTAWPRRTRTASCTAI